MREIQITADFDIDIYTELELWKCINTANASPFPGDKRTEVMLPALGPFALNGLGENVGRAQNAPFSSCQKALRTKAQIIFARGAETH